MPQGNGLKKPLNAIENPIFPDIKKGPPRFVWSRKHWQVDPGAVMRDTEPYTHFYDDAVLAQSRDYNKTVYGQSSHKDIVNANFRPPMISYYEDVGPLNRVPATIHAIIPHINPGTADHDGYAAKNERNTDIVGALTDRVSGGEWRPTFYAPMEVPQDNSVLPDLEAKLPSVSAHAGWEMDAYIAPAPAQRIDLEDEGLSTPIFTRQTTNIRLDGPTGMENYETYDNRPQVSASAGVNVPITIDGETPVDYVLYDNRPQVSASAGMNTPINIDSETPIAELEKKLGETPVSVLNPGTADADGFRANAQDISNTDGYIQDNRPSYSYAVTPEIPTFRTQNVMSYKPHFMEKIQPEKTYGQISQSGGATPHMRATDYYANVQGATSSHGKRINPLAASKKKAVYSF